MAMLTQGTQLYMLLESSVPGEMEILEVECAISFSPGEDTADRIDVTCLSADDRAFLDGLTTPGEGALTVNADSKNASHLRMYALSKTKKPFKWAVGFSDGKGIAPALNVGLTDWELPDTRTWFAFSASISSFPFDFTGNSVVATAAKLNRTGASQWTPKAGSIVVLPVAYTVTVTDPLAFVLRMNGVPTAAIDASADSTDVKTAIEAAFVGVTAVVTGSAGGPYSVTLTDATGTLSGIGATVVVV